MQVAAHMCRYCHLGDQPPGSTGLEEKIHNPQHRHELDTLSEGLKEKTLTDSLGGFFFILCSRVLSTVYLFPTVFITQQSLLGNIGITVWLHSVFQVSDCNAYEETVKTVCFPQPLHG